MRGKLGSHLFSLKVTFQYVLKNRRHQIEDCELKFTILRADSISLVQKINADMQLPAFKKPILFKC